MYKTWCKGVSFYATSIYLINIIYRKKLKKLKDFEILKKKTILDIGVTYLFILKIALLTENDNLSIIIIIVSSFYGNLS